MRFHTPEALCQDNDSTIKLLDYNARWYDSLTGRFISPDTIIPDPANPQSFNRYSYVRNNPLRYTDPSGHDPTLCTNSYASPYCIQYGFWTRADWEAQGVVFTGLADTDPEFSATAVEGLNLVLRAFGLETTRTGLGLDRGRTLTINGKTKSQDGSDDLIRGRYYSRDNTIVLFSPGATVHEVGHAFDYHAGPCSDLKAGSGQYASEGIWPQVVPGWRYTMFSGENYDQMAMYGAWNFYEMDRDGDGWVYMAGPGGYASDNNVRKNPKEDFASTFEWYVYKHYGDSARWNRYSVSQERQMALDLIVGLLD